LYFDISIWLLCKVVSVQSSNRLQAGTSLVTPNISALICTISIQYYQYSATN